MCGIYGVISNSNKTKQEFKNFCETYFDHRGRDSKEYFQNEKVLIGHNRLSITGANGIQPLISDKVILSCNGEIYDYKSLRTNKYVYQTDSDNEVILDLFSNKKMKMMSDLNGEFAFALADLKENKLYLARDRFGIKPLYFKKENNEVFFASEMKSLSPSSFNENTLSQVYFYQYHDDYNTLFDGIYQVPPGFFIEIDLNTLKYSINKYWDFEFGNNAPDLKSISTLLEKSVQRRIPDSPFAITLSGGLDSAIIAYLAKESNPELYNVSFIDQVEYNESEYAKKYASEIGLKLNVLEISHKEIIDNLEKSIVQSEEININGHVSAKDLLMKEISKKYKIVLSGEGSDEIFLGYSHFLKDMNQLRGSEYLKGMHLPVNENNILNSSLGKTPSFIQAKVEIGNNFRRMLDKDYILNTDFFYKSQTNTVNTSVYYWTKMALNNYILQGLGDKQEMSNTIEGRVPFLDFKLVENLMKISPDFKVNNGVEKFILKQIFKSKIPDYILLRTKHPFVSPNILGFNYSQNFLKDIINSSKTKELGFNQSKMLEKIGDPSFETAFFMFLSVYFLSKVLK